MESLIGHLQHACKVIPQDRTFLHVWQMINLLSAFRWDGHTIRLNQDFRLNLPWWHEFFHSWDGFSFLLCPQWAPLPEFHVSSDAAGALGYSTIIDNGLAPSTRQVYGSSQRHFLEFCSQDLPSNRNQPLLPANGQTSMHFCAHLADRLHHTSIKVYLSAVHSPGLSCLPFFKLPYNQQVSLFRP